jgi:hypothetical protein
MRKMMLAVVAALALSLGLTSVAGAATFREFEGKVVSVDRDAKTFRLKDHDGRGTATIKVTSNTRFEDLAGFSALKAGLKRVEAKVKRVDGAWVARKIELSGRDDDRADDDRGGDRHGGRGGDDDAPGDDHGGNSGHGGGDDD